MIKSMKLMKSDRKRILSYRKEITRRNLGRKLEMLVKAGRSGAYILLDGVKSRKDEVKQSIRGSEKRSLTSSF